MRFAEIISEARMGAKELQNAPLPDNFTIGFEFEIVGDSDDFVVDESTLSDYGYDLDALRTQAEDETEIDYEDIINEVGMKRIIGELELSPLYDYANPSETEVWTDDDQDDQVQIDDIGYSEIEDYFDNFDEQAFDELYVSDKISDMIEERYQELVDDIKQEFSPVIEMINYVQNALDNIGYSNTPTEDYHDVDKEMGEWYVEPDSSIDPIGAEVVTSVYDDFEEAMVVLEEVLDFIDDDNMLGTNSTTGLHINIGTFDREQNIDWAKFLIFLGDNYILNMFDRMDNSYAKSYIDRIKDMETYNDYRQFDDLIVKMNKIIMSNASKYQQVNFEKLINGLGYIELRQIGGAGYERKFTEIKNYVGRILRAIAIASDVNAYRKEYIKKLQKLGEPGYQDPIQNYQSKELKSTIQQAIKLVGEVFNKTVVNPETFETKDDFVMYLARAVDDFYQRNKGADLSQVQPKFSDPKFRTDVRNVFSKFPGKFGNSELQYILNNYNLDDYAIKFFKQLAT